MEVFMNKEFITDQIKRIKRNLAILGILIIAFIFLAYFYKGLGLMIIGIVLFSFILRPISYVNRIKSIKYHSVNKAISVYGNFYDVAQNINSEVICQSSIKYGNVIITDSWILKSNIFSLNVIKISDIVWSYLEYTKHKVGILMTGGAIPAQEAGKTVAVVINSANPIVPTVRISTTHMSNMDNSIETALEGIDKEQRMRNILEELHQRNPYAIVAYTKELAKMWITDKSRLIDEVKLCARK
jgi:hypothetical protein